MRKAKTGEAISPQHRTAAARKRLRRFIKNAKDRSDLAAWQRGKAILGYIDGERVVDLAERLEVSRGSVNRWLGWYEALGVEGLLTGKPPGAAPKLSEKQRLELGQLIEAGPLAAGYTSGVWTGPMIADLIQSKFDVSYHNHHVPRLLNQLGFSVQRPRKRLARADVEAQEYWVRTKFPAIKKKPPNVAVS
jgi:transposase